MTDNATDVKGLLRSQHDALQELIDIVLSSVRESGDSSVSAIHLLTRLNKLADTLRRSALASPAVPLVPVAPLRT